MTDEDICSIGCERQVHACVVVDGDGVIVWRGVCPTDPAVLAATLERHARGLERVVLETGPLSAFLYHGLIERGVPAVCICARHAKGALSVRINKSDAHDADWANPSMKRWPTLRCAKPRASGSREWLEDMEARTGLTLVPGKRGPKPKAA